MSGDFCFYQIDEGGTPLPLRHSYVLLSIGDALREMEDAHIALRARVAELTTLLQECAEQLEVNGSGHYEPEWGPA